MCGKCSPYIEQATEYCAARGLRLTEPRAQVLGIVVEAGPPLTWDAMQQREFCTADEQQRWYAQAYALVDYIDREYDLAAILGRLMDTPHTTLEDALRAEVGLNSAQVMQGWRIKAGLEARPRTRLHPGVLRWMVIGLHLVAIAGLSWWRVKLRLQE